MSGSQLSGCFCASGHFSGPLVRMDQPVCLHAILITGFTGANDTFLDPSMAAVFSFDATLLRSVQVTAIKTTSPLEAVASDIATIFSHRHLAFDDLKKQKKKKKKKEPKKFGFRNCNFQTDLETRFSNVRWNVQIFNSIRTRFDIGFQVIKRYVLFFNIIFPG